MAVASDCLHFLESSHKELWCSNLTVSIFLQISPGSREMEFDDIALGSMQKPAVYIHKCVVYRTKHTACMRM